MANFVLVPGFWLGGWAWRDVEKILREKGHEVFPVTLTGLGERVHLSDEEINLDMHVADVVNLIEYNELGEVYLAGHSYGGIVITQIADLIPEKIAKLIYVDSAPLPDGVPMIDFYQSEEREMFEKSAAENNGFMPLPEKDSPLLSDSLKDVSDEDWARFEKLATAQPFNVVYQKLNLKNPQRKDLKKLAILSTFSTKMVKEMIESGAPLFQELGDPNFEFAELPTGHYPMFSRTAELAEMLNKAVKK
jgi:pimeloyl-ACP methyl ester carboxylesterase